MKERIKELAEQAGWMMSDEVEGFNIRLEKFAELLVQECTAPPKKEWVGLTGEEARKFYEKYTNREELIYAIDEFLEEKNGG